VGCHKNEKYVFLTANGRLSCVEVGWKTNPDGKWEPTVFPETEASPRLYKALGPQVEEIISRLISRAQEERIRGEREV
jgi:hypothetical protein